MRLQTRRKGYVGWRDSMTDDVYDALIFEAQMHSDDEVIIECRDLDAADLEGATIEAKVKAETKYTITWLREPTE